MIKAILFDLDGVLIKTEWETFLFYKKYLKKLGINLKDSDFKYKVGRKSADFWNDVLTAQQMMAVDTKKLTELKRKLFNRYPAQYVTKMPGVKPMLIALRRAGYQLALTTQNENQMMGTALKWLKIGNFFETKLSLQDIKNKKPHPEIYQLAAKRLGLKANECLVIEDSGDGVAAAKNARMLCIGVKHAYTPRGALARADARITNLSELAPKLIEKLEKRKSRPAR